jgi:hypothetical protein
MSDRRDGCRALRRAAAIATVVCALLGLDFEEGPARNIRNGIA